MKAVFADTFYYLAQLDPHDSFHERAVDVTRSLRQGSGCSRLLPMLSRTATS